jgi:hypothetical protein
MRASRHFPHDRGDGCGGIPEAEEKSPGEVGKAIELTQSIGVITPFNSHQPVSPGWWLGPGRR